MRRNHTLALYHETIIALCKKSPRGLLEVKRVDDEIASPLVTGSDQEAAAAN